MKDSTDTACDQANDQEHHRYPETLPARDPRTPRPAWRRYVGEHQALTPEVLAELLAPGDVPLADEQLCTCGCLEADHRLDGPCSRCRRCRGFLAADAVEDPTVEAPAPTEAELVAELARKSEEAAARDERLTAELDEQRRRQHLCRAGASALACERPRGHEGLHATADGDFEWNFNDRGPEAA